jgi:hypothetical protein
LLGTKGYVVVVVVCRIDPEGKRETGLPNVPKMLVCRRKLLQILENPTLLCWYLAFIHLGR